MSLHHVREFIIGPDEYQFIWNREARERGQRTGGIRHCGLDGCTGVRVGTRWPDGKITWPCTKGLIARADGDWQIS